MEPGSFLPLHGDHIPACFLSSSFEVPKMVRLYRANVDFTEYIKEELDKGECRRERKEQQVS